MDSQTPAPQPAVMRDPRHVDVEITSRCNLRCRYCYFFDNPQREYDEVSTAEWLALFDEMGRSGVMTVELVGGEPFIRDDLKELVNGIVANRMRFTISSNGSLVTDDLAAFLAATGRCDHVQVSVDGSNAAVHDACRGQGSFAGALRGIRTLQRHGVRVAVRVTVNHHNVDDLEAVAALLLDELGLPCFSTNSAGYLGSCKSHSSNVLLSVEERSLAMQTLLELSLRYPGRITAQAGPLADAVFWQRMVDAAAKHEPQHPRRGTLTGCGCPSEKMAVRSDGSFIPCNMLSHATMGVINQDRLRTVWQEGPALTSLRQRHTISLDSFAFCAGCEYIPYCTGNCPGLAYSHLGLVDHPSPDACLRRFLQDGGRLPVVTARVEGETRHAAVAGENA